ncbi:hypothetical protein GCM10027598_45750 [Amycolatopsis oliviviridis]|uniref:Nucleotidyltransferase domain-containing protein n=1 Tax=Amycolatopsis oliviviridis TaxID=1471590 RepID=A0ABQ3L996_9PSEU|nr:nucleotidyltransferase domain-containing protein [Amycolatopsis oliviviridis]GHH08820.1 hypothetical protein GCM10017790_16080 [Amycolatopsis oliviviridis]
MFSIAQRTAVRDVLLSWARDDAEVSAAALVGSAATGREDAWSDIDLALRIGAEAEPDEQFRATQPGFELVFGTANTPTSPASPDPGHLVGMGWLYGLHARSAIARGRRWQALLMLDGVRDQVIALACVRHGLNPHHGRDADKLPAELLDELARARARATDDRELHRANEASIGALVREIARHDETLAQRLAQPAEAFSRP